MRARPNDYLLPPSTSADEFRISYVMSFADVDPFAGTDPFASGDPSASNSSTTQPSDGLFTDPTAATNVAHQQFGYDNSALNMGDNSATLPVHEQYQHEENVYSLADEDPTSPILDQV